jgi:hypothetical protein
MVCKLLNHVAKSPPVTICQIMAIGQTCPPITSVFLKNSDIKNLAKSPKPLLPPTKKQN